MNTEQSSPEVIEYNQFCPLLAAVQGRDEDERWLMFAKFQLLPEDARDILTNPKTIDQIKQWSTEGMFPSTHMTAVSKLIGLAALDDEVTFNSIASLLQKIGLTQEQAEKTNNMILSLLQPVIAERARESTPKSMPELPPLTTKIPQRNIIDLRKQQPNA